MKFHSEGIGGAGEVIPYYRQCVTLRGNGLTVGNANYFSKDSLPICITLKGVQSSLSASGDWRTTASVVN